MYKNFIASPKGQKSNLKIITSKKIKAMNKLISIWFESHEKANMTAIFFNSSTKMPQIQTE